MRRAPVTIFLNRLAALPGIGDTYVWLSHIRSDGEEERLASFQKQTFPHPLDSARDHLDRGDGHGRVIRGFAGLDQPMSGSSVLTASTAPRGMVTTIPLESPG